MIMENLLAKFNEFASFTSVEYNDNNGLTNRFVQQLFDQRKAGYFCDITLKVDSYDFLAHKCILAINSSYFEKLLLVSTSLTSLKIESKCSFVFEQILDYMYLGNVTVTSENIIEIIQLSNLLSLDNLKEHIKEFFSKNLNLKTCFTIDSIAKYYNLTSTLVIIDEFIFANIQHLLVGTDILDVSLDKLNFILSRSMPLTDLQRLNTVINWIGNKPARDENILILLHNIQWNQIDNNEIEKIICESSFLNENPFCLLNILKQLKLSNLLPKKYLTKYNELELLDKNEINKKEDHITNDELNIHFNSLSQKENAIIELDILINTTKKEISSNLEINNDLLFRNISKCRYSLRNSKLNMHDPKIKSENDKENESDLNENVYNLKNEIDVQKLIVFEKTSAKVYSKKPMLCCQHCDYKVIGSKCLKLHMKKVHNIVKMFKCEECQYTTIRNKNYFLHMLEHYSGPPFQCAFCGVSFTRITLFLSHKKKHVDEQIFVCSICGQKFKNKFSLEAHSRRHAGKKPFKCTICDRKFTTKGGVDQHMPTHYEAKPYLCDLCGFSTKYQSHLKNHRKIHTGDVFHCSYAHCTYTTPKRSLLGCHMRSHLRILAHTCTTCGRAFVEKSHLVRHERIHLEVRPFRCELCNYASTRLDKLKEHHKKYHEQNDEAKVAYRPRRSRGLLPPDPPENNLKSPKVMTLELNNVTKIMIKNGFQERANSKDNCKLQKKTKFLSGKSVRSLLAAARNLQSSSLTNQIFTLKSEGSSSGIGSEGTLSPFLPQLSPAFSSCPNHLSSCDCPQDALLSICPHKSSSCTCSNRTSSMISPSNHQLNISPNSIFSNQTS